MEKGEALAKTRRQGSINPVRAVREALRRRQDEKHSTMLERLAAYQRLCEQCDKVFETHADKVGTVESAHGEYQRLVLKGVPGTNELVIDKGVFYSDEFTITGVNTYAESLEGWTVYDRTIMIVSPRAGSYRTDCREVDYVVGGQPEVSAAHSTKEQPLAAGTADEWTEALSGDLVPFPGSNLMTNVSYPSIDQ